MTTPLIEKAARALQKAWDDDDTLPPLTFMESESRALVIAVLKAIREPNEEMCASGREVPCDEETHGGVIYSSSAEARAIWQAMMDSILNEGADT